MSPERIQHFREKLETLAAELRAALKDETSDAAPVVLDTSIGRLSRMDAMQSQQMALALKQRQQNQLMRVETAIQAVKMGTYGDCRRCGNPISDGSIGSATRRRALHDLRRQRFTARMKQAE